jgi:hypothetical protein
MEGGSMSDTPRTDDEAVDVWWNYAGKRMERPSDNVPADFARQLEREIAEARQQEKIHFDNYASMKEHRDRLAALIERNRQDSLSSDIAWNKLRDERNDAIEQRDRLAEAFESIICDSDCDCHTCQVAREALAAVKGGSHE